jgi:hypothetical protein
MRPGDLLVAIGRTRVLSIGERLIQGGDLVQAFADRRVGHRRRVAARRGRQLDDRTAWLDANCGAGNWAITPAGLRGVVNDALAIYLSIPSSPMPSSRAGASASASKRSRAVSASGRTRRNRGSAQTTSHAVIWSQLYSAEWPSCRSGRLCSANDCHRVARGTAPRGRAGQTRTP